MSGVSSADSGYGARGRRLPPTHPALAATPAPADTRVKQASTHVAADSLQWRVVPYRRERHPGCVERLDVDMRRKLAPVAAEIARRQHGVVARRQLLGTGVTGSAIDRLVRSGWLHPLHRGVYAVGH